MLEERDFRRRGLCLRPHPELPIDEPDVGQLDQKILRDVDGDRSCRIERKNAASVLAMTNIYIVCRSAQRAEYRQHVVPSLTCHARCKTSLAAILACHFASSWQGDILSGSLF